MKEVVNLYWYKLKEGNGNFGDELNYYLVKKLSDAKVRHIIIPSRGIHYIYKSLSYIYHGVVNFKDYKKLIHQFFINNIVVAVGSVIGVPKNKKAKIWGSGIIKKDEKIHNAQFIAVRGKYTQQRLLELGFKPPKVIGDPAILLPLVYNLHESKKKYKLGIIPHHIHFQEVFEIIKSDKIKIINLTENIEDVICQINSCEITITTSLHGLIVSHVYGIPSLWFDFKQRPLFGDNIKFADYFSSVNIPEYKAIDYDIVNLSVKDIKEIFEQHTSLSKINCDIAVLQKSLLLVAPFKVLEKYKCQKLQ
ncbi:polysaccharide pyruvyl transferase family protein [Winogradskyella alexanderae]|uniref:Polysaccharide pyruvyl transferase family protein n=1 Tax=Winogradskyella alexanderae TaxID=2877123 RepID=A0ABS7XUG2_9FLAO|nr:polysaccharide pyruvyl transferase family protein [Winogradskyella alexanderae]MCA0132446.1 polysaccharide pyruvyl transferase family protein [Winogradskyella alexanderae]